MTTEGKHKHSAHPIRKKILRVVMLVILGILFLEFVVYFGSNLLLNSWARNALRKSTDGVYQLEFNRINFSLIRRGVFLDGLVLKPAKGHLPKEEQVLFDLTLDEVSFRGLWFDFSNEAFQIHQIRFDNPDVRLVLPEKGKPSNAGVQNKKEKVSPVKFLENELLKSIRQSPLSGVLINEVLITHADLFFLNFLSPNSLHAENTSLIVRHIDLTTEQEWKTPFNARGFEFNLKNASFPLPDGVHSIKAKDVRISSLDDQIDIKGFLLQPDYSKESPAYYQLGLEELRVGNVDLNHAFMTSEVSIDEVVMKMPDFFIRRKNRLKQNPQDGTTGDLNELIEGLLKSISIKELDIQKGKFRSSDFFDSLKNRIDIESFDFKMTKFYLGEDESKRENQFFYGEDAAMEITDASLHLADEIHLVTGKKVSISTFKDEFMVSDFSIRPIEQNIESKNPKNLLTISLPSLALNETDLRKLYNEGKLESGEMIITDPKLEIIELGKKPAEQEETSKIGDLIDDFLNEVSIGKLSLANGEIQFKNSSGLRSDDVGFEKFSLELEDIKVLPDSKTAIRDFVFAEELVLQLDQYHLKLKDNLHEFLADRVIIDSKNSLVEIINLNVRPENPNELQKTLDAYGKTAVLNLHLPAFRAEGIDVQAAFRDEILEIGKISVTKPEIGLSIHRVKKEGTELTSSSEISDLLNQYFAFIRIDSLSFTNGKLSYENFSGNVETSFQEDDFAFTLKGFEVQRGKDSGEEKTFFSEEIDLKLNEYSFSLADGAYEATTDGFNYNSKKQRIVIENLQLVPGEQLNSRVTLNINLPWVSMEGADIEKFLFSNELNLQKFSLEGGEIELGIDQKIERQRRETKAKTPIRKSLEIVSIDTIQALSSILKLNYLSSEREVQSVQTGFEVNVFEFHLDSTFNSKKDFSGLFSEISLALQDFTFALPDSIHVLSFNNVIVDNSTDETVFTDFKITPQNFIGKPGKPIVDLKAKEFGISNNSLEDIQSSGILNLHRLRLTDPVLNIFMDSIKDETSRKRELKLAQNGSFISSIRVEDILLQNGNINFLNKNSESIPLLHFDGVNVDLPDLNLDILNPSPAISSQFLLEKDLSLSLLDYELYSKDRLNKLKIGKVSYLDKKVVLENIRFSPVIGRYEYLRKIGSQTDVVNAEIDRMVLDQIDSEVYFSEGKLKVGMLTFENPVITVFRDKRMPEADTGLKPMPQFLMQNFSSDLFIDQVKIRNGTVKYQEFGPKSVLPGTISFERLDAELTPFILQNPKEKYPIQSSKLNAHAYLMGTGEIQLNSTFYYTYPFPMEVAVHLGPFDLTEINDPLSKMVFVGVKSGQVNEANWNFTLTDEEVRGKMTFLYEDLKVEILDSLTLEKGRGRKGLIAFAANTLLKNSNPRGLFNKTITSDIYFIRDTRRFIFNAWWKATFSGLRGSVGLGRAKMPAARKEEEE
ncbi:hypothetical protein [Algoriphagus sp. CAU 1675]|uniref:hypothetical protein n=1 Tax=Algoriphagus sp. CAU 1675 TaxID=3032597 RepID=UPI0023DCDF35|nr:hypothetical protein [Algoriphagus sp. CAU 1675]MDF2158938.1 hypothetical protein [Algoriphagus sp. CAU 1675]